MAQTSRVTLVAGDVIHFLDDPACRPHAALEYLPGGALLIADGRIVARGAHEEMQRIAPADAHHVDHLGKLILPGFIDTHVHYPQTEMIASHGEQLLAWLEKYTFPAESRFADRAYADDVAGFFCDELLRNGTTTAMCFSTVHTESVDALFAAAQARRMRLITGKVLMDRNCPDTLRDTAESGDADSRALIARWHGRDRLGYAVTPRFAATSTPAQMTLAGVLFRDFPDLHLQSHVAENRDEIAWIAELYPEARSYLDVYDRFGQLGARAIYAHCIWLDATDRRRMAQTGTAMSFCPTSNLFLGSGLFDLHAAESAGIRVGLGTDVGAGTSFSILQTMNEAYKVLQLNGQSLSTEKAFYLATLGGARSLGLDAQIGNFEMGKEADFVVLDPLATPLIARRMAHAQTLAERLFVLMMLADDRAIAATYLLGTPAWQRA